jgi:hypothetical protein
MNISPVEANPWTEYMRWLSYANAGMLAPGNLWAFDHAIKNLLPDTSIVEIGSFCGLSTNAITHLKEKYGAKNRLVTCDKWKFDGAGSGTLGESKTVTHDEYREFCRSSYIRNVELFGRYDQPYTIEAFSDEFFEAWANQETRTDIFGKTVTLGGPIGFAYIDGCHDYAQARRDFENTDKFLALGGFILFDDSNDGSEWEVCRVVREVEVGGRYQLLAKTPHYYFQKIAQGTYTGSRTPRTPVEAVE